MKRANTSRTSKWGTAWRAVTLFVAILFSSTTLISVANNLGSVTLQGIILGLAQQVDGIRNSLFSIFPFDLPDGVENAITLYFLVGFSNSRIVAFRSPLFWARISTFEKSYCVFIHTLLWPIHYWLTFRWTKKVRPDRSINFGPIERFLAKVFRHLGHPSDLFVQVVMNGLMMGVLLAWNFFQNEAGL